MRINIFIDFNIPDFISILKNKISFIQLFSILIIFIINNMSKAQLCS